MINNDKKNAALLRVTYEILMMKKYCQKNQITQQQIADKSGITQPNVWRFLNMKSAEPSIITFILIAQAIGYKVKIEM